MDLDRRAHVHAHAYAHQHDRDRLLLDPPPPASKRSSSPATSLPLGIPSKSSFLSSSSCSSSSSTTTAAATSSSADRLQLAFALNSTSDVHQSSHTSSAPVSHPQPAASAPALASTTAPAIQPSAAQRVISPSQAPVTTSFVSAVSTAASGPTAFSSTVASAAPLPPFPTAPSPSQSDRLQNTESVHSGHYQEQQVCTRNPAPSQVQTQDYNRPPQASSREQVHSNINNSQPPLPPPQPSPQIQTPLSGHTRLHSNTSAVEFRRTNNLDITSSKSSNDLGDSSSSGSGHPLDTRPPPPAAHATTTATQHVYPPSCPPPPRRPSPHLIGSPSIAPSASTPMSHLSQSAGTPRQHSQQPPQHNGASPTPHQQHAVSYAPPAPHHYAPAGHAPPPQYGYPTPGGQSMDQYRSSPGGAPQQQHHQQQHQPTALPGLRAFDQQIQGQAQAHPQHYQPHPQQQPYQQVQHHAQHNPYSPQIHMQQGGPIGSTMAPGHVGYFAIQPQQYMHDPMGMRYGIPPGMYDPRMQLSGGRHKKVCTLIHLWSFFFPSFS